MLQALKQSFRRFCLDTNAWREQLESIDLTEEILAYVLESDAFDDVEIRHIVEVRINTEDGISEGNPGALIDSGLYAYYPSATTRQGVAIAAGSLVLDDSLEPAEDVTGGLEVMVSLVPNINSTDFDAPFVTRWSEAVVGWAMFWLKSLPGRKWTDKDRALVFQREYYRGVSRARLGVVCGEKAGFGEVTA